MADDVINVIDPNAGLNDLAKEMGVDLPQDVVENQGIKNTGFSFYKHKLGNYTALIGELSEPVYTREVEGKNKKCKAGDAGAKKSYSMLMLMIIEDPEGKLVNDAFSLLPDISYGRVVWQQYITLDSALQFRNKTLFNELKYEGVPQLDIIQGNDNDFTVKLELLKHFYYGAPVTFTLEQSATAKNPWIKQGSLKLRSNKLSKEVIAKRKRLGDALLEKIIGVKDAEEAERKAKQSDSTASDMRPPEADTSDSMLADEGYEV